MLYEPQHNMFRGANKIICGVDITRLWDVGTEFFINECLTNIFAVSELKKNPLAQVLLLKVINFLKFQFTNLMFGVQNMVFTSLVYSVIHTGELHILVAKSCHTISKDIFNGLWQLAVLAMDS